jgi:hypothetical protein
VVRGERVGLAAGAVEREHLLGAEPLPVGVLADERLQVGRQRSVAAGLELRVDPRLQCRQAGVVEPRGLGARELLVCDVRERGTSPEREGLAALPRGEELLEAVHVELAVLDP